MCKPKFQNKGIGSIIVNELKKLIEENVKEGEKIPKKIKESLDKLRDNKEARAEIETKIANLIK